MLFLPTAKRRLFLSCIAVISWFWCSLVVAAPISLADIHPDQPLGRHAAYMKETAAPLTVEEAIDSHAADRFVQGNSSILSFGIGAKPVWIHLSVTNPGSDIANRRLFVENSWLDHLDVYFVKDNRLVERYRAGDAYEFQDRPVKGRFFSFDHSFGAGVTDIYLRVETPDPMVVPIFLLSQDEAAQREAAHGYSYGFLYGYLLALLAYNLFIYFGLSYKRHLLYGAFIAAFILTNLAYTGHGFEWFWQEHPTWQNWIIPVLMVIYGITGLTFAKYFLDTESCFPRAHKILTGMCGLFAGLLAVTLYADTQLYALLLAFFFVTLFSVTMIFMGVIAFRFGHRYSRYFLLASIASMAGTTLTSLSVWGFIPFSDWTYRAVEIGMTIDATLLALALAYQFRSIQVEHKLAEQLASSDPLTGLNNRRAFVEKAQLVWNMAQRSQRELSVIILDIDHFKSINDRYGHAAGDTALVAVSEVLSVSARDEDVVARWGGEEFLILLPETGLESALVMAERLKQAIQEIRVPACNAEITFTASFGVAHKAEHENLNELISEADRYLYQSKEGGRNRISSGVGKGASIRRR